MSTAHRPATRTIEKTIEIAAPLEAVWQALTGAEELSRWFPLEARVEPRPGGKVFLSWGPQCEGEGTIDIFEPLKRLRWREPAPVPPHTAGAAPPPGAIELPAVEWLLETKGGRTVLRLVNSGISAESWADEYHDSLHYGWGFMLANLRLYLERHHGQPRLVAWPRRNVALPRAEAWTRLVAAGGFADLQVLADGRSGDRASLRAAGDTLAGTVEFLLPPRGFCLRLDDFASGAATPARHGNPALLWLSIEGAGAKCEVGFWLSAYSVPRADVDAFGARWQAALEKALP
jgi:uncharacterized protein YndB with AHSA1/START domain